MKKERSLDIISSLIIFVVISILTFLGIYGNSFFRDFPIIFDGGYRIFIGMSPFVDFSLFPIPVPFYLQAFFNSIFGPGLISMGAFSIFMSATLSIIFYFICRKHFSRILSILAYPWYNQVAFFYFTLNFFLLYFYATDSKIMSFKDLLLVSTILTILTIFSKMEVGLLHFLLLVIYLFIFYYKERKEILKFYVIPFILCFILIFIIIKSISIIGYGFSESLVSERLVLLFSTLTLDLLFYSFSLYIFLIISFFLLKNIKTFEKLTPKSKKLVGLVFLITLFSLGVLVLTGLPIQNKIFALPLILVLIYILFKRMQETEKINFSKKTINLILIVGIFLIILSQFTSIGNYQIELFNYIPNNSNNFKIISILLKQLISIWKEQ